MFPRVPAIVPAAAPPSAVIPTCQGCKPQMGRSGVDGEWVTALVLLLTAGILQAAPLKSVTGLLYHQLRWGLVSFRLVLLYFLQIAH